MGVQREHISAFQVAAPRFSERKGTTAENPADLGTQNMAP